MKKKLLPKYNFYLHLKTKIKIIFSKITRKQRYFPSQINSFYQVPAGTESWYF